MDGFTRKRNGPMPNRCFLTPDNLPLVGVWQNRGNLDNIEEFKDPGFNLTGSFSTPNFRMTPLNISDANRMAGSAYRRGSENTHLLQL